VGQPASQLMAGPGFVASMPRVSRPATATRSRRRTGAAIILTSRPRNHHMPGRSAPFNGGVRAADRQRNPAGWARTQVEATSCT